MQILVNSKVLVKALKNTSQIVKRVYLPILKYALLSTTNDNSIKIEVTNISIHTRQVIEGTIIEPGSCLLPVQETIKLIGSANTEIEITSINEQTSIKMDQINANFDYMLEDDFPKWKLNDTEIIGGKDFLYAEDLEKIQKILYAASNDDSRFNLNNIAINMDDIVATDGHRLSMEKIDHKVNDGYLVLIPKEVAHLICSTMKGLDLWIDHYQHFLIASTPNITILWERITGDYPDYERVLPERFDNSPKTVLMINKKTVMSSLKQIKPFTNKDNNSIVLLIANNLDISTGNDTKQIYDLCIKKGNVIDYNPGQETLEEINNELKQHQTTSMSVPIRGKQGESFSIIVNCKYILDIINSIDEKEIILSYFKEGAPIKITSINKNDYHIVMPKRQ